MKLFYEFVGGEFNGLLTTKKVVCELGNGRFSEDLSEVRANGGLVHRAELDNQPLVDGYLSPMWDGTRYLTDEGRLITQWEAHGDILKHVVDMVGILRYETQKVYDMLSR